MIDYFFFLWVDYCAPVFTLHIMGYFEIMLQGAMRAAVDTGIKRSFNSASVLIVFKNIRHFVITLLIVLILAFFES